VFDLFSLYSCGYLTLKLTNSQHSVRQNTQKTSMLSGLKFSLPKGPCCSTNLTKFGELQPSKKALPDEKEFGSSLLVRTKEECVAFHYPTVKTPSDLRALLEKVMLEGVIEVDCAAITQIVLFMRSEEANRPPYFVLAFGCQVWEHTTFYQRQQAFSGLDVNSLCIFSKDDRLLPRVASTIDAVALTFGEKVASVTNTSRSYSSHWLCVDRKGDELLGFTGLNADNQLVRMSLEEWFDFLVCQVDADMKALNVQDASMLARLSSNMHACFMGLNAYKFEEAMVLVVGAKVPAQDFLSMACGSGWYLKPSPEFSIDEHDAHFS
jgi:hypothetical protein